MTYQPNQTAEPTLGQLWREAGRPCHFSTFRYRMRPLMRDAHSAVTRAVRRGSLPKATERTCTDCGGPATEYDHRDYSKPLDVEPVCRRCNVRRGPAYPYQ